LISLDLSLHQFGSATSISSDAYYGRETRQSSASSGGSTSEMIGDLKVQAADRLRSLKEKVRHGDG
jgi:hypothetical protein